MPHGEATEWHSGGQVASTGYYRKGARDGRFDFWDESGTWIRQERYVRGELTWSSTMRYQEPPGHARKVVLREPDEYASPLWEKTGLAYLADFPEMEALATRDGVVARVASHEIFRFGTETSSQRFQLSFAHSLESVDLAKIAVYAEATMPRMSPGSFTDAAIGRSTIEFGGRWKVFRDKLWTRIGLMLPVAADNLDGYRAAIDTVPHHLTDTIGTYPRSLALRMHGTYIQRWNLLNFRVDSGIDTAFDAFGDESLRMKNRAAMLFRMDAGAAVALRIFGVAAQVHNATPLIASGQDESLTSASLSLQLRILDVWPSLSFTRPLLGPEGKFGVVLSLAAFRK